MLGPSAKLPSAKWTEHQVTECQVWLSAKRDRVPSGPSAKYDRVPSMTECQLWQSAKCDQVPSVTKCQIWPSAKYDWVPSGPSAKWQSAKWDRVPSGTECQMWPSAKWTECQVWPSIKYNRAPNGPSAKYDWVQSGLSAKFEFQLKWFDFKYFNWNMPGSLGFLLHAWVFRNFPLLWSLFTYYLIILGVGGGVRAMIVLIMQGGAELGNIWCALPRLFLSHTFDKKK